MAVSFSTLLSFIRLCDILHPVVLHRLPPEWDTRNTPAVLPPHVASFISHRLGLPEEITRELWTALGMWIWTMGRSLTVGDGDDVPGHEPGDEGGMQEWLISEHMLYPEVRMCINPRCAAHGQTLRLYDLPTPVQVFTLDKGAYDAFSVRLTCKACETLYYPNYVVYDSVRQYYAGIPEFIQVSEHKYIARTVLEHFTTLSVLSWTSATNAAHIYHESMSKLEGDDRREPRFRLRTSHTWDGFVLLALLRDTQDNGGVLDVPHLGNQKDRFTEAMQRRNARIRASGQPEYAHWCNKCVRRFDDPDGVTRFVDCVITDGISIGRPCCGVLHCTGRLRTPQELWCYVPSGGWHETA